ncbi:biogenesis of lysosome-related organelles complex 1 subunit 3 [Episyrphus balteatus]|uniref:biogenesis of lysosome-related organelles complex 1 subunit 3 n=1 Tax=Episyrphus balteatus TaxID=286459 RepID=UPI00248528D4|nr:biogenesis of lysosome-related organelles complex 1 subunit 3 [Episyrphus balteatus]
MSLLVLGEASESEEETIVDRPIVYAKAVAGEAAESDEDVYDKNDNHQSIEANNRTINNNEFFHKKLVESNIALWKNLNNLIRNVVLSASKQLLSADQILMKSQVSMQSALSSVKGIQTNVKQLKDKTEDILTANFIPQINI